MKDLVAFYATRQQADQVKAELLEHDYDHDDISIYDRTGKDESSIWTEIKSMFGFSDEDDQRLYAEAARRGAVAVALSFDHDDDEARAREAVDIMLRHQPLDLNQQAQQWRQQGWKDQGAAVAPSTTRAASTTTQATSANAPRPGARTNAQGEQVLPVVQEELKVGTRTIERGAVRIYSRVSEKPVEEQVKLRKERVPVERRPVDRPVTAADTAKAASVVEVRETDQEAVVNKEARAVEEVVVGKEVQERTQTVRDKVRRTDVNVENTGQSNQTNNQNNPDQFPEELARDQRFAGCDWQTIEPQARTTFEQRYPGSKWDQFKDAVHRGYERVKQKV